MSVTPHTAGFYWAKWRTADPGTREGETLTPSDEWEVVQVVENGLKPGDADWLMVFVPGVERSQSLANFAWGPQVRLDALHPLLRERLAEATGAHG